QIVGVLDTVDDIAGKAKVRAKDAGREIDRILKQVDKSMPDSFSNNELAAKIIKHADDNYWQPANKGVRDKLYQQAEELKALGNVPLAKGSAQKSAQSLKDSYRF